MVRNIIHTLELRSSEVFYDICPIWRIIISSQIWLQLSTQNLEGSTLSNTVGTHQTQYLSRSGCRQSMELEAVGGVSVGDMGFEVRWKIDDIYRTERAFLGANTTSTAKTLRYEGDF